MSAHRQLAAVMVTDIEGYTAIMQQSEQQAIFLRDRQRAILKREHQNFQGQIIQYYGDGTLSIFNSAVEAVHCAFMMQKAFLQEPRVPVRIGLHIGDIILDDAQAIGEGVRVASEIESLGKAGSILLSDKVNDEISNHPEFRTTSLGKFPLKNMLREVEIFALDHNDIFVPRARNYNRYTSAETLTTPQTQLTQKVKSIAVLPLVNLSNDPEQKYFSDGVAEEILNSLAHVKDLRVAGRTSSFQFQGKDVDLREVGEKLGVNTVLEGSVRKQGNRLRVIVQLVNVEDGFQLWAEKYDRTLDDIFAIQDEIALAITEKMKVTLQENGLGRTSRSYTQNTRAYELYLKGRFYINRRGPAMLTGIQYCKQALEMDPEFALAHAGYADGNLLAAFYGLLVPSEAMAIARVAAETAVELDPALCEPYCSLGFYYDCCEWNWAEAEKYYLKSIKRNPQYAQAHMWYGLTYLAWVKEDFEQAEEHARIAIKLDPLNANAYAVYSVILHAAGKYQEALAASLAGLELNINSYLCRLYEANAYVGMEQYEAALVAYDKALLISNRHAFALNLKVITYCKLNDLDKARELLAELKERAAQEYVGSAFIGLSEAYLGNMEAAFRYLNKALEDRESVLLTFRKELWVPAFLRATPQFQSIMDKMSFPVVQSDSVVRTP